MANRGVAGSGGSGLELESIDSQTMSMADEKLNETMTTHYPKEDPITEEEDNVDDDANDTKTQHSAYDSASQASDYAVKPARKASKEQQKKVLHNLMKMKIKTDVNRNLMTVADNSPQPLNDLSGTEVESKTKEYQTSIINLKKKIAKMKESILKNDYIISNLNLDSLNLSNKEETKTEENKSNKNDNDDDQVVPSTMVRGTSQDVISRRFSLTQAQYGANKMKASKKMKDRDKINAIDWCSDNERIVTASNAGAIIVWDCQSGQKNIGIPLKSGWTQTVTFSPDGKYIACGGLDNLCSIFSIVDTIGWHQGGLADNTLQHHEGYISCIRYVSKTTLLTASGDGTIALWDIDKHSVQSKYTDHMHDVQSVAVCPNDPNLFVSGAIDAKAKLWDMRLDSQSACIFTFEGHSSDINKVSWFPDGNSFITASEDSTLKLFDLKCLKELNCYFSEKDLNPAKDVSFSKSGQFIFASYDEAPYCIMWDTISAHKVKTLDLQSRSCLQVSPNGNYLATGSWDSLIRLWTMPKN